MIDETDKDEMLAAAIRMGDESARYALRNARINTELVKAIGSALRLLKSGRAGVAKKVLEEAARKAAEI